MEDAAIVELFWQRSEKAITETDRKYGRYCRSIACNICGIREDAEECVNDTWFQAWNRMPEERPGLLSVFLGGITRNLALDRVKTGRRKKRGSGQVPLALEELAECVADNITLEQTVEDRELERTVGAFVAGLPETEKIVFILRYWYLVPVSKISEKLQFSESKTKSILFRTRKKLKSHLQEVGLCRIR